MQKNGALLQKRNPALTEEDAKQLMILVTEHLLYATRFQRLSHVKAFIEEADQQKIKLQENKLEKKLQPKNNHQAIQELENKAIEIRSNIQDLEKKATQELAASEEIKPHELELLVFSYYANVRLWPSQIETIREMKIDPTTGKGKPLIT